MCDYTPIMKQYLEIKAAHKDKLLFFRMGDFYELFFEDAEEISKLLSLVLTSRGQYNGKDIPMAGFPCHAVNNYILKLMKFGKKVAICEQIGTIKKNGLLERKVVKIFSPGMFVSDEYLKDGLNNYIICISFYCDIYGIAALDLSTGYFFVTEVDNKIDLFNELDRIEPVEVLVSHRSSYLSLLSKSFYVQKLNHSKFDYDWSHKILKKFFGSKNFDDEKFSSFKASVVASGCLLDYVLSAQNNLDNLSSIEINGFSDMLYLDANTRKNLEIFKSLSGNEQNSLLNVIDFTVTPMGKRLIRRWLGMPLLSHAVLKDRLMAVSVLKQSFNYLKFRDILSNICDVERILSTVSFSNIKPTELKRLQLSLEFFPKIKDELSKIELKGVLESIYFNMNSFEELSDLISKVILDNPALSIKDGYVVRNGFDVKLDKFRDIVHSNDSYILDHQIKERFRTGLMNLKIGSHEKDGYYIDLPKTFTNIPDDYRKFKNLSNSVRYVTNSLKDIEYKVLNAKNDAYRRELKIYKVLLYRIKKCVKDIKETVRYISMLDVIHSYAKLSSMYDWCEPELVDESRLEIYSGRHPLIERNNLGSFIPNDLVMDFNNKIFIITGANMGGKSTYMRQAAIIVLLACIGAHVPAKSAVIGKIDKIFTRIGAGDDLVNSCSTFMLEMKETADILNRSTENSLVLIDEIGRGTNYMEGRALAWSVLTELLEVNKSFVLFSTHFCDLSKLVEVYHQVKSIYFKVLEFDDKLIFCYKFTHGFSDNSFGINVAKMAGLSPRVIKSAYQFLSKLKLEEPLFVEESSDIKEFKKALCFLKSLDLDMLSPKLALDKLYFLKNILDKDSF